VKNLQEDWCKTWNTKFKFFTPPQRQFIQEFSRKDMASKIHNLHISFSSKLGWKTWNIFNNIFPWKQGENSEIMFLCFTGTLQPFAEHKAGTFFSFCFCVFARNTLLSSILVGFSWDRVL
jgi:hypothetical protein